MNILMLGAIVLAMVQLAKMSFNITSRYIPLVALFMSALIFTAYAYISHATVDWKFIESAFTVAFTACGIWSGTKSTIGQ